MRTVRSRLVWPVAARRLDCPPLPPLPHVGDAAVAATVGYLTGGLILTIVLQRRGHRQLCQVARNPLGFAAWLALSLHLWTPRWDPVRAISNWRR